MFNRNHEQRTGTRTSQSKIFKTTEEAQEFLTACQEGRVAPPRLSGPVVLSAAGPRLKAELDSGRVVGLNGGFCVQFTY